MSDWRTVSTSLAGDSAEYAVDDFKKLFNLMLGGNQTLVDIASTGRWKFRDNVLDIANPANTFKYQIRTSAIVADRAVTLPLLTGNDTIVTEAFPQALTNKTIVAGSNTITGIVDANITAHTTSKITTTTKGLLNSAIVYNDQTNTFGAFNQVIPSSRLLINNPANTFAYTVIAAAIGANRNLTLPLLTGNDTMVTEAFVQTLTNKTIAAGSNTITGIVDANITAHTTSKITTTTKGLLNSAIAYTDQTNTFGAFNQIFPSSQLLINNPAGTFAYTIIAAAITAGRNLTLPLLTGNDTMVTEAFTQTLTNKTISGALNTISNIPDSALTANVALKDAAQTFTAINKFDVDVRIKPITVPSTDGTYGQIYPDSADFNEPRFKKPDGTVIDLSAGPYTFRRRPALVTDCPGSASGNVAPYVVTLILSATNSSVAAEAEHPGIQRVTSSTTANSGALYATASNAILLAGGEVFECIMQIADFTNNTVRIGFLDNNTVTAPVDGVYFEMATTSTISGKTMANSVGSTTGTTFTATAATWYRFRITVTSTTRVDFYIYDMSGTELFTANLTTNIPNGAGRQTGAGVIGTNSATTGGSVIMDVDYIGTFPGGLADLAR